MAGISRRPRCQSRSPRRRQNGRPYHPALGAPRLLQSQDLGLGRLSRPAPQAPPDLSRRVRLPLQPPAYPACRIPFLARHRRSPPAPDLQHVDLTGSKGISLNGDIVKLECVEDKNTTPLDRAPSRSIHFTLRGPDHEDISWTPERALAREARRFIPANWHQVNYDLWVDENDGEKLTTEKIIV